MLKRTLFAVILCPYGLMTLSYGQKQDCRVVKNTLICARTNYLMLRTNDALAPFGEGWGKVKSQ